MQLSTKYKFAFLCIPKCGSTSVEKAIRRHCETRITGHPALKHLNARKFHRFIRPLLHKSDPDNELETFCIMRDPVERIESWYTYQTRSALAKPTHPEHKRYTGEMSFTQFIEGYLAGRKQQPIYAQIGTQALFVRLPDGSLGVDRIFRLDQMLAVGEYLSQKIGKPIEIPMANQSPGGKSASKSLWKRLKTSLRDKGAPAVKPPRPSSELSEPLMQRLLEHLADDYEIYNSLPRS